MKLTNCDFVVGTKIPKSKLTYTNQTKTKLESKIREMKKTAKALADNLELYSGERKCPICGCEPEKQVEMSESEFKAERERVIGEIRHLYYNCEDGKGFHADEFWEELNELKGEGNLLPFQKKLLKKHKGKVLIV